MARKLTVVSLYSKILVLGSLLVLTIGAPMSENSSNLNTKTALKLLGLTLTPHHENVTNFAEPLHSELEYTEFYTLVCPLFLNYTRFNGVLEDSTLESNETDPHHSLVTFMLNKSMEATCLDIKESCNETQECSVMNCTLSSIGQICLKAPINVLAQGLAAPKRVKILPDEQRTSIPSWIRENMSGGEVDPAMVETLVTLLKKGARLMCTGPPEEIACIY